MELEDVAQIDLLRLIHIHRDLLWGVGLLLCGVAITYAFWYMPRVVGWVQQTHKIRVWRGKKTWARDMVSDTTIPIKWSKKRWNRQRRDVEDLVTDGVEEKVFKGEWTREEARWWYMKIGKAVGDPNFYVTQLAPISEASPQDVKSRLNFLRKRRPPKKPQLKVVHA